MASRRARIKTCANIPIRKKPVLGEGEVQKEPAVIESSTDAGVAPSRIEENSDIVKDKETTAGKPIASVPDPPSDDKSGNTVQNTKQVERNVEESESAQAKPDDNNDNAKKSVKAPVAGLRRRFIKPTISTSVISRAVKNKPTVESSNDINSNTIEKIDPTENVDVAISFEDNKNASPEVKVAKSPSKSEERKKESDIIANNTARAEKRVCSSPLSVNGITYLGKPPDDNDKGVNINLNETSLPTCQNSTLDVREEKLKVLDIVRLKPQYIDGTKSGSDTEYPPPPVSPSKYINRPRIKAVPRLGRQQQRRTSFSIGSASESEDDTRKTTTTHNRIRNDSVCSAASANGDNLSTADLSPQKKEYSSVIQRKCRRTEQSRKLAEARREFMLKFRNEKPDRQRLTMMDLIFYNPITCPMSQKKKRNDTTSSNPVSELESETVNDADDPKTNNKDEASDGDEENTVPAPQITIGANGEIIVDEKSLVIENKATIKGREALKQSQIVNGDFDMSYGVYKRVKRSKDWSKQETLRFFKALNTIGTDFTMMTELFPGRSRRELKLKFKKEERMNKFLVDRAVMQPVQFDLTELRRELEVEEIERREAERSKKEIEELRKERAEKNNNTKRKRRKNDSMEMPSSEQIKKRVRKTLNKRSEHQSIVKNGINSLLDSDSDSSTMSKLSGPSRKSNVNSDSESEAEEITGKEQTTKSGRISRPRKSADSNGSLKNGEKKKRRRKHASSSDESGGENGAGKVQTTKSGRISKPRRLNSLAAENNNSKPASENVNTNEFIPEDNDSQDGLTPGSLMILNDVDANGDPVQRIFTVNEDGKKVPIELTPDLLSDLLKNLPDCNSSIVSTATNAQSGEADNSLANLSLGINADDLVIDDDMLVIPFDEIMAEQGAVKV